MTGPEAEGQLDVRHCDKHCGVFDLDLQCAAMFTKVEPPNVFGGTYRP